MPFETRHGDFTLTDDLQRFDLARAHGWIGRESYWAQGIPFDDLRPFGARQPDARRLCAAPAGWRRWRGW